MIRLELCSTESDIRDALSICGSPLERMFLVELLAKLYSQVENGGGAWDGYPWEITVQPEYESFPGAQDGGVLLGKCDFSIELKEGLAIGIEIDGHEFHEKTKDQARRDKRRERSLISAWEGPISIVRFTGSEVYASPGDCAKEALDAAQRVQDTIITWAAETGSEAAE